MKLFGLIGYPLTHSFSKQYFTQKISEENITDCQFELFPLNNIEEFPELLKTTPDLSGLAVTIPYKELIIPYLHHFDSSIVDIKAVNCISFKNGQLTGHNTDVIGFEKSFLPLLKACHKKALILGTGGASKAVKYILNKNKIPFLLVSRNQANQPNHINYELIDQQIMNEYTIIINASPVGMTPNEIEYPNIPYDYIGENHLLYDLIYKPEQTIFLKQGLNRGAVVKNGFEMLLIQAEENWKIWNQ